MEIDRREAVQLGASTQWIRIRAVNTEPERFRELLAKIRLGLPATT